MRYVITQSYTPGHAELFDTVMPVNSAYASSHGFEYISSDKERCPDRAVWWEKIAWLMELLPTLEEGSLVLYMDCDSVCIGGDPGHVLHDGCEFGMVSLRGGMNSSQILNWYNAGVIAMVNGPDVRSFLARVWDRNDETDETSLNNELRNRSMTIGANKKACDLGPEWNCWDNNAHLISDVCIKSWHGVRYEEKLQLIKEYLKA